jgi:integrase
MLMGHIETPFPGRGLKFPQLEAKPPFRTPGEIERRLGRGRVAKEIENRLWESAFLSLPEIEELLSHVKQASCVPYLYPVFVFAAHTGARRSEMLRSDIDDIDFPNRVVPIRERKRVRGTKSTRTVPLSAHLHNALSDWLRNHPDGNFTRVARSSLGTCKNSGRDSVPLTPDVCHKGLSQNW